MNKKQPPYLSTQAFLGLVILLTVIGLLGLSNFSTILTRLSDVLYLELSGNEYVVLDIQTSQPLVQPLQDQLTGVEIRTTRIPQGSIIIRRTVHRNFSHVVQELLNGKDLELWYEPREQQVSFQRIGTLWQLRIDDQFLVEPVAVLIGRHNMALPPVILGSGLIFIVVPILLITRRVAQAGLNKK